MKKFPKIQNVKSFPRRFMQCKTRAESFLSALRPAGVSIDYGLYKSAGGSYYLPPAWGSDDGMP
jgi:hypothetical protein